MFILHREHFALCTTAADKNQIKATPHHSAPGNIAKAYLKRRQACVKLIQLEDLDEVNRHNVEHPIDSLNTEHLQARQSRKQDCSTEPQNGRLWRKAPKAYYYTIWSNIIPSQRYECMECTTDNKMIYHNSGNFCTLKVLGGKFSVEIFSWSGPMIILPRKNAC